MSSYTMKIEVTYFFETVAVIYQAIRRRIWGDNNLPDIMLKVFE
jgi:hypothetical protein